MKQIPNLFTLLNLVCGCLALIFVLQNGIQVQLADEGNQYVGSLPEKIGIASLFIGLAALIDFLDGLVARVFKAASPMGKQLDSLADVVSFGVAPGMILYEFLRMSLARQENGLDASIFWCLPALLIPCAAAFRLAKFNIDDTQQFSFRGVPTPAAGLLIASLPLIYWYSNNDMVLSVILNKWFLYGVIVLLSYLMVSDLPMLSLKFSAYSRKTFMPRIIFLAVACIAAVFLRWMAAPALFVIYIIVSLIAGRRQNQNKKPI